MTLSDVDFDRLAPSAKSSNGGMAEMENLYGHSFALPTWLFLARGSEPNVTPYVASTPQYADGQPMIHAFTDPQRLIQNGWRIGAPRPS